MSDTSRSNLHTHERLLAELRALIADDNRVGVLNGVTWDVATALERIAAADPQAPTGEPVVLTPRQADASKK